MQIQELDIPGIMLIETDRHADERGFFSEIYNREDFARNGIGTAFVQENYSLSKQNHTVRGLHFQTPPFAQAKLVQVVQGAVLDVVVDVRRGSPHFGRYVTAELSAANWQQLFVPIGFAHGFCTLEPDTAVIYKVSAPWSREHDAGIAWDDPALGIDWPAGRDTAVLSARDAALPRLADCATLFSYPADSDGRAEQQHHDGRD